MLKNNEPDKEFEDLVQLKEQAHALRMESEDDDTEITEEEFFTVLCKFESKKSTLYNFIMNT